MRVFGRGKIRVVLLVPDTFDRALEDDRPSLGVHFETIIFDPHVPVPGRDPPKEILPGEIIDLDLIRACQGDLPDEEWNTFCYVESVEPIEG